MEENLEKAKVKMEKAIAALDAEFKGLRAGHATPAVLDKVLVDYYGTPTPIQQMAAISVPEGRMLQIQPWDISTIKAIEKAIQNSDLGINPQNDGRVIRLVFPALTEERRHDMVKDIHKMAEEAKVAVRSIRRDAMEKLKAMKKTGEVTEDDLKDLEKQAQQITDEYCKEIDGLAEKKVKETMEI